MSKFDVIVAAFKGIDSDFARFLVEEGDKRVAVQVSLLTAGDARANGLLGVAAAFAAAGVAIAADNAGKVAAEALFWAATGFSVTATAAAVACVWALWPCKIQVPGWDPATFLTDARDGRDLASLRIELAALEQIRLDENRLILAELGWRARLAMCLLAASPAIGGAFGLLQGGHNDAGVAIIFVVGCIGMFFVGARGYAMRQERKKLG